MKTYLKWLKAFLALEVRNLSFFIALLLPNYPLFVQPLDLVDFLDAFDPLILLLFLAPLPPTTSLLSSLEADVIDNLVILNIAISGIAILLKPRIKRW